MHLAMSMTQVHVVSGMTWLCSMMFQNNAERLLKESPIKVAVHGQKFMAINCKDNKVQVSILASADINSRNISSPVSTAYCITDFLLQLLSRSLKLILLV